MQEIELRHIISDKQNHGTEYRTAPTCDSRTVFLQLVLLHIAGYSRPPQGLSAQRQTNLASFSEQVSQPTLERVRSQPEGGPWRISKHGVAKRCCGLRSLQADHDGSLEEDDAESEVALTTAAM